MIGEVRELFDEYTARFARGEHPDPVAFLDRAGDQRDDLRELIDGFLRTAPAPAPTPEMVEVVESWIRGESPLLELRRRKGATHNEVVDTLVADLEINVSKREKVARYYHRLESGLLDVARVDGRVFMALAKALGIRVTDLAFPSPVTADTFAAAYLRSSDEAEEVSEALRASRDRSVERDEVDELFEGAV